MRSYRRKTEYHIVATKAAVFESIGFNCHPSLQPFDQSKTHSTYHVRILCPKKKKIGGECIHLEGFHSFALCSKNNGFISCSELMLKFTSLLPILVYCLILEIPKNSTSKLSGDFFWFLLS